MALSPVGAFALGVVTGGVVALGVVALGVKLIIRSAAKTLNNYRAKLQEAAERQRQEQDAEQPESDIPSVQWPEDPSAQRWIS